MKQTVHISPHKFWYICFWCHWYISLSFSFVYHFHPISKKANNHKAENMMKPRQKAKAKKNNNKNWCCSVNVQWSRRYVTAPITCDTLRQINSIGNRDENLWKQHEFNYYKTKYYIQFFHFIFFASLLISFLISVLFICLFSAVVVVHHHHQYGCCDEKVLWIVIQVK